MEALNENLKEKTVRGGAAKLVGQFAGMLLRLGSLMILARILEPRDFGVVAMVVVFTGVLEIFATGGLSIATVQKAEISDEQVSALFWINVLIGIVLCLLCLAAAPLMERFYHDLSTVYVTAALGPVFIVNALGVQHQALLQRQLRYVALSMIEVVSQVVSAAVSIVMALAGWGYWSLVAGALAAPLVVTIGAWLASGWRPARVRRAGDVAAMLRFGGTVTLNGLVMHVAYNIEKVLLGRYFGSDALGIYSRAYQLINLPTQMLNAALGGVAFSALSRLQNDPARFKSYFLKGYSFFVSVAFPVTIACAVLADDIILVVLGSKWREAADIFRLLSPTILIFAIINPLAWVMQSIGFQERSLRIALVLGPLVICSYLIGIPYGPRGVALAYSTVMLLWVVPHVCWCLHRTPVSPRELLSTVGRPLVSGAAAGIAAAIVQELAAPMAFALLRLALAGSVLLAVYAWVLLVVMKQRGHYVDLMRTLRGAA